MRLTAITDQELDEIEARVKAASPGPWMKNGKTSAGWRIDDADPNRTGMVFFLTPTAIVPRDANADFIAAARDDVPLLVEEVRRLRKALEVKP